MTRHELAFNGGVATAAFAVVLYEWRKSSPFWFCAALALAAAVAYSAFFARRFRGLAGRRQRGGGASSWTFEEAEAFLLDAALRKAAEAKVALPFDL